MTDKIFKCKMCDFQHESKLTMDMHTMGEHSIEDRLAVMREKTKPDEAYAENKE